MAKAKTDTCPLLDVKCIQKECAWWCDTACAMKYTAENMKAIIHTTDNIVKKLGMIDTGIKWMEHQG